MTHRKRPMWQPATRIVAFVLLASASISSAITSGNNPYTAIIERNSFGLKPPPNPADLIKPPPPVVADIKLQGISTILGRSQVLLKVKVPAKPPEPARDQSFVIDEGNREGDVEVLEINPVTETVRIKNSGNELVLTMKDHGERPTPGAAAPAAPANALPGMPPPATPTMPGAANPAAAIEPFGGNKMPALPTRNIRTSEGNPGGRPLLPGMSSATPQSAEATLAAQQAMAAQRTPEENVILYEANRLRREQSGNSFIKFPQHPALKGTQSNPAPAPAPGE